jgi:hypothetical protein
VYSSVPGISEQSYHHPRFEIHLTAVVGLGFGFDEGWRPRNYEGMP